MKVSLFYLIHPANSNSYENWVFSRDFRIFKSSSTCIFTGEAVKTTTDQRNLYIIGRDKIYICSKKRAEMQFILFDESR